MIKATIQNTPYCTEMSFPCTETELLKKLGELGINKEHLAPTGTIIDIEPAELSVLMDCEVSLDALNYLGKRMDGMSKAECNQFFATLTCKELNFGYGLKNIINLTYNLARYTLIEDTNDLERVGRTHMLNIRGYLSASESENKEWLADEGKKMIDSGKGIDTEYGSLFVNEEIKFEEIFNGTVFPPYYCDPYVTVSAEVSYKGETEFIELPNEDIAIRKALARIGADSIGDCEITIDGSCDIANEWWEKIKAVENTKDLLGLNNLLKTEDICLAQTESAFMNEVKRVLLNEGYNVVKNGDFLVASFDGRTIASVNDIRIINNLNDNSDEEYLEIKGIVGNISEYCSAYEKSPLLKAEGLSENYHCLSEFNGTVLAAKNGEYGFQFVTWNMTFDGKGVTQGNYYTDYLEAKENFAVRSGLIDKDKLFGTEDLENIRMCLNFTARHNGDLSFDDCDKLKTLSEKISECISEQQQSDAPELSM